MLEETIKVPKLIGAANYELWAICVKAALIAKECWGFYTRDPDPEPSAKVAKEEAKALSFIQLAYEDGLLLHILKIEAPAGAWALLEHLYSPRGFSSEFIFFKEFFGATLSSLGTVDNYLATIQCVITSLKAKSLNLPDKLIIAWTLYNLGFKYEAFVASITQTY